MGFDASPKTYQRMSADWILGAPSEYRVSFLRGWSDGDGGVSARGYYFSISTHSDHDMARKLLDSLGVRTHTSRTYVRTTDFEAVQGIAEIKPFRNATDRQAALEKAVDMIRFRRPNIWSNPIDVDEVQFMVDLRNQGLSYGAIGEQVFDRYGYSLDARDIRRLILRQIKDE